MKSTLDDLANVLARAGGKGASLKVLASQLQLGKSDHQKLRKLLAQLLTEGRASFDGHVYRAASKREAPSQKRGQQREQGKQQREPQRPAQQQREPQRPPQQREPQRPAQQREPQQRDPQRPGQQREREPHKPRGMPAAMAEGQKQRRAQQQVPDAAPVAVDRLSEVRSAAGHREAHTTAQKHRTTPAQGGGLIVGILHLKAEGYGFVSPILGGQGRDGDLFIPPQFVRGALDGDVVRARAMKGRDGRLAGEVVEIVEQRRQLALGTYRVQAKASWVEAQDRGLSQPILVPRDRVAKDGDMVKVRLERDRPGQLSGEVIGVLGPRGDPRYEILASAYAAGFSDEFDAATVLAAEQIPDHVRDQDRAGRRDLRELPLVTIDGEDARDFDDAVHVSRVGSGYRLVVAIADVAHYVRPGGPLDREALRRGTSVYFPGTVLPMLPERLSNGICSLNPDVDRLCMVCDLALDSEGRPVQADLYEAVMRSHARLTYTKVAAALEGNPPPDVRPLLPDLQIAGELAKKLTRQRRMRGSIDFDLPEGKIILDEQGGVREIARRPRNDAHRLVEEFMLAANEGVARFFDARGLPTVYRIHDRPDDDKLAAFAQLARLHGFELPDGPELTPGALNAFLLEVEGKPQQKALNSLLLRAMMQAQYSPDNIGHYGLAAPHYLHFTSPIRRYPDLMVHRLLKENWARSAKPLRESEREEQEAFLAGVAAQCSERERASMKAERDIDSYYAAVFMQDKVGEKYDAVVAGVAEFGLFCELAEVYVEGLVPAEELGDSVELDLEQHRLVVGRSGKSFGVGDEVKVEVVSADPVRRRITLALQGGAQKTAPRGDWLRPEDLDAAAAPRPTAKKPLRRPGQQAPQHGQRPPPRGSRPGQKSRHKGSKGRGR